MNRIRDARSHIALLLNGISTIHLAGMYVPRGDITEKGLRITDVADDQDRRRTGNCPGIVSPWPQAPPWQQEEAF